ncbi:hypothetical protein FGM00_02270 [Aggregatimonas sangjinii]|uniref:Uncharacterized protein n=1 Tax=Aggregatimonas sangjinii TaxID=2583587 RepID=A0A5B7SPQ3_9FLAO|nr:hypothetical protein [Aggregatimonas sangjinii]QCW98997.1 hypothetical protein FGM00_02270 [Aggregatimonas sangjinii]
MNPQENIQLTLEYLSIIVLGGLVIFQLLHFIIGSWRFWKNDKFRIFKTISVGIFWVIYGSFFVTIVTDMTSYYHAVPYVLCGLYLPSIIALFLIAVSKKFKDFVDQTSLRWTIQSVGGPARMIVGIIFLFWFFAGRLPGVVAWVAGPGDWISGYITFYAVKRLRIFKKTADLKTKHWSISDLKKNLGERMPIIPIYKLNRNLNIAIAFVAFGILDFILAPASTALSIFNGNIPEEMGRVPLTLIPLVLVPQVLLLEIFAMRQLIGLKKIIRNKKKPVPNIGNRCARP